MLERTTRRGHPRPAELVGLDRGDGRQVAGDERQDARREEREEPREQRDRDLAGAHASNRSSSSSTRRSSSGSTTASGSASSGSPRRRSTPRRRAHADHADAEQAERHDPGEQVETRLRRLRENAWPELVDEVRLDLGLGRARGELLADDLLHPPGDRRVGLVEGRLAGRADELGLEVRGAGRCAGGSNACREHRERSGEREPDHGASPSASATPRS